jgi:hypothetical protein
VTEPTLKQWKRRALKAEAELESIREMRKFELSNELNGRRKNAAMKVAIDEIQDALNWMKEMMDEPC